MVLPRHVHIGALQRRLGEVRLERQRAVEGRDRLVVAAEQLEHVAAVDQRIEMAGRGPQRRPEGGQRLLQPAELLQRDAAIAVRIGEGRGQRDRPVEAAERRLRRRRPASAACRARCSRPDAPWRRGRAAGASIASRMRPAWASPAARADRRVDRGIVAGRRPASRPPPAATSSASAAAISAKTPAQSPAAFWRNSRMVGYQGESVRSISQRQSGWSRSATQTGRPSAPARCAGAESDTIIRSRLAITAAISRKPSGLATSSSPSVSTVMPAGRSASWSRPIGPAR